MSKRGSVDDFYFNGDDDFDDGKKPRTDAAKPSRVLHFRNVPSEIAESEIIQLGLPFGKMTNMLLIRSKRQALLEMGDIAAAQSMVNYYSSRPIVLYGHTIYVQYSCHEHLKTTLTAQNTGALAALQAAHKLMKVVDEGHAVLHVTIDNMTYPVTIDVLQQIFEKFGQVLKINTFTKNGDFQALIQLNDAVAAQSAQASLNGKNIYDGCCTLRIELSKHTDLNVLYNNEQSRDFTNPHLPSGPDSFPSVSSGHAISEYGSGGNGITSYGGGSSAYDPHLGGRHSPVLLVSNLNEETLPEVTDVPISSDDLFPYCGHKRPVWDEHDSCVRCRQCSYNDPCPTCISWSRDKWRSAEEYWQRQAEREQRQQQQFIEDSSSGGGRGWDDGGAGSLGGIPLLPTPGEAGAKRTLLSDPHGGSSHPVESKIALLPNPEDDWQQQQGGDGYGYPPAQPNTSMDWYDPEEESGVSSGVGGNTVPLGQISDVGRFGEAVGISDNDAMKQTLLTTARILGPELCAVKSSTDASGALNIAFPPSPAWFTEFATASSLAASLPSSGSNATPFLAFDDLSFDLQRLTAFSGLQMRQLLLDEDISELGKASAVRLSSEELADWEAQLRHSLVIPSVQDFIVAGILKSLDDCPPSRETAFIRKVLGLITANVGQHMQVTCRLLQNVVMARRDAHLAGCNMSEPTRKALRTQSSNGTVLFGGHLSRFVGIERARQASGLGSRAPPRR